LSKKRALWIKDPLSTLADAAERGVVVREGRIVELVPAGRTPVTPDTATFDAGALPTLHSSSWTSFASPGPATRWPL
jgi:hypothetical protein